MGHGKGEDWEEWVVEDREGKRRGGREGCQRSWTPAGGMPAVNSLEDIRPAPAFSSGFDLRSLSSRQVHEE